MKDGSQLGISLDYSQQSFPDGMVHAIFIGRDFIGNDSCCLILGDNIFYGTDLVKKLQQAVAQESGATVFAYPVNDPQRYGVVELSQNNEVLSLEEKPDKPKSRYAVTGIYFYDNRVLDVASSLKPSLRGELEITDINQHYLNLGQLKVIRMGRGSALMSRYIRIPDRRG